MSYHFNSGFGAQYANLIVYCANTPESGLLLPESITALTYENIVKINTDNGNGWRKIFNVYAKLLFEIDNKDFSSWQHLREQYLLQSHCQHQLILNPSKIKDSDCLQILMGKTFGLKHFQENEIQWLEVGIGKIKGRNIYITPYFDYRQFNNEKITSFSNIISKTTECNPV